MNESSSEMLTLFYIPCPMSDREMLQFAATVEAILNYRGGTTRSKIEFELLWTDGALNGSPVNFL